MVYRVVPMLRYGGEVKVGTGSRMGPDAASGQDSLEADTRRSGGDHARQFGVVEAYAMY